MPDNPDSVGFGVYIHWPFCAAKCPYCDFNSHVRHGGVDQNTFLAAYLAEIATSARATGPRQTTSVFFGGGTPSLMEPATVAAIIDRVDDVWPIAADAEITLEANPTSVEAGRFAGYRSAGVNRVSLGVQSLRDDDLERLGRRHTAAEARAAIDVAARTFDRHSFDLIYARPHQTARGWERELCEAIGLGTRHLSLYQLTIEAGTPFAALYDKGRLSIPPSQEAETLFRITRDITSAAGLPAYETSNHAAPGEESRHNLLYWRYGEYAGIGPGAHGRLIVPSGGAAASSACRLATSNDLMPEAWSARVDENGDGIVEREALEPEEQADEYLMMSLRLAEGTDMMRLAALSGLEPAPDTVAGLVADGLLDDTVSGRLRATERGAFVLNELVLRLSQSLRPV